MSASALAGPAVSASAAAVNCTPSATYEVDEASGQVILYPRATCNGDTLTLAIYGSSPDPGESRSILYTQAAAGAYSGYGIAVPNRGPDTYCIGIQLVWTSPLDPWASEALATGCVQT